MRRTATRGENEAGATAVAADGRREPALGLLTDARWALYVGLVLLNLLDVVTTQMVLDRGGSERNPFVQPFIEGMWDVAVMKLLVLAVVGVLLVRCRDSRLVELALAGTTGWYLAVVMWNCVVLVLL